MEGVTGRDGRTAQQDPESGCSKHQGSDMDLCLEDLQISNGGGLLHERAANLESREQRVGQCIWRKP